MTDTHPPAGRPEFRQEILVAWGDCDAAGIVFYANYFHWFDWGMSGLLARIGLDQRITRARWGTSTPLVDARARYLITSSYDERILLVSDFSAVGRASFTMRHRILKADGRLACEGTNVHCWVRPDPVEPARIQAEPMPPEVRAAMLGEGRLD